MRAQSNAGTLYDPGRGRQRRRQCAALERAAARARLAAPRPGTSSSAQSFSSLTRRIVFLNVTGLLALVIGILYLSQFRAGLIDARIQSLLVQGEIIAGAIAASATVETDTITIDPERLLDLQAGESYGPSEEALSGLEFPINPGARRAGAAPPRLADQDARAHLRPRRRPASSTAAISSAATCCASICRRRRGRPGLLERAYDRHPHLARPRRRCRSIASSGRRTARATPRSRNALQGFKSSMVRDQRTRRGDRLGRGAGAALPRGARRAACCRRRAPTSTTWSGPSGSRSSRCS